MAMVLAGVCRVRAPCDVPGVLKDRNQACQGAGCYTLGSGEVP